MEDRGAGFLSTLQSPATCLWQSHPGLLINTVRQSGQSSRRWALDWWSLLPLKICESKGHVPSRAHVLSVKTHPTQRCETPRFNRTQDLLRSPPMNTAFSDFKEKKQQNINSGVSDNPKFKDYIPTCTHAKWIFSIFRCFLESIFLPEKFSDTAEPGIILWTWWDCMGSGKWVERLYLLILE